MPSDRDVGVLPWAKILEVVGDFPVAFLNSRELPDSEISKLKPYKWTNYSIKAKQPQTCHAELIPVYHEGLLSIASSHHKFLYRFDSDLNEFEN